MAKKARKHNHRIIRLVGGRTFVYKCADPECCYLVQHAQLYHLIGRACICFGCGEKYSFTEEAVSNPEWVNQGVCNACLMPGVKEIPAAYETEPDEVTKYLKALKDNARQH